MRMRGVWIWVGLFVLAESCREAGPRRVEIKDEQGRVTQVYYLTPDSMKTDTERYYDPVTGRNYLEIPYQDGKAQGVQRSFYPSGTVEEEVTMSDGRFHGPYRTYYPSGQLKSEAKYVDNALSGLWTSYYENGQVKERLHFRDNEENGPFVEYYENGHIKAKGTYKDGDNEDGLLELYDERGQLVRKMQCNMGRCRTVWKRD